MCCAWHRALAVHRLDELVSPTPDGEYTGRAVVKLIFNIGKVRPPAMEGSRDAEKSGKIKGLCTLLYA